MDPRFIRNFCIIAHIDHGKSTLADRLLELTGALSQREMTAQVLDSMDLERERGITIKAKSIRLHYPAKDGHEYQLNLIDTPGHVDFSYEVSRALSACEGALLVVDASQGVEAQTVANAFLASRNNLEHHSGDQQNRPAGRASGAGQGADRKRAGDSRARRAADQRQERPRRGRRARSHCGAHSSAKGISDAPLQALIFDSWFDPYRGAVVLVRVMEGRITPQHENPAVRRTMKSMKSKNLGVLTPKPVVLEELAAGEVGFVIANIKRVADARVGDTIVDAGAPGSRASGL